jgi:hypothetical protein
MEEPDPDSMNASVANQPLCPRHCRFIKFIDPTYRESDGQSIMDWV